MKRWAGLTVAVYALAVLALTWPVLMVFASDLLVPEGRWSPVTGLGDMLALYREWGYWLWLGVLLLCQALLLVVPLGVAQGRPIPRRRLAVPMAAAAFLMANLALAGGFSLLCLVWGDDAFKVIEFLMRLISPETLANPVTEQALRRAGSRADSYQAAAILGGLLLALWGAWGVVFSRLSDTATPEGSIDRFARWLLRGSILEFLVAVPSHIVVRHRGDCCAPMATFWGIVTGLSIMLLAFGPSLFFLFARRFRRLQPGGPASAGTDPDPSAPVR